jgi:hypothetical protein
MRKFPTLLIASMAMLAVGTGAAFADGGQGPIANTYFTELPGVIAQPAQQPARSVASAAASATHMYIAKSNTGVWLFPPNPNQGANS